MSKWGLKHKGVEILTPEEWNTVVDALDELSVAKKWENRHTIKASYDTWTESAWTTKPEWGQIMLNRANYGTVKIYLEIAVKVSGATGHIRLFNVTDNTPVDGSEIAITNTDWTVLRSAELTLPEGDKTYAIQAYMEGAQTGYITNASILIIQTQ